MKVSVDNTRMQQYIDYFYAFKNSLARYDKAAIYYHFEEEFEISSLEVRYIIDGLLDYRLLSESVTNSFRMTSLGEQCSSAERGWLDTRTEVLELSERNNEFTKSPGTPTGREVKYRNLGWLALGISVASLLFSVSLPWLGGKLIITADKTPYHTIDSLTKVVECQRVLLDHINRPVKFDMARNSVE